MCLERIVCKPHATSMRETSKSKQVQAAISSHNNRRLFSSTFRGGYASVVNNTKLSYVCGLRWGEDFEEAFNRYVHKYFPFDNHFEMKTRRC